MGWCNKSYWSAKDIRLISKNADLPEWQQIIWAEALRLGFRTHSTVTCFLLAAHVSEGAEINPAAFRIHFRQHLPSPFKFGQPSTLSSQITGGWYEDKQFVVQLMMPRSAGILRDPALWGIKRFIALIAQVHCALIAAERLQVNAQRFTIEWSHKAATEVEYDVVPPSTMSSLSCTQSWYCIRPAVPWKTPHPPSLALHNETRVSLSFLRCVFDSLLL